MKKFNELWILPVLLAAFLAGAGVVKAGLGYGTGSYVNLCGSGTVATKYSCNSGCNPSNGTCISGNNGAVRYICSGRWDQCLESEGNWGNSVTIGNPGCGNTVQLSLFDKQCRRDDGSWDPSCNLLGYMVWYSGDCPIGAVTPFPTGSTFGGNVNPTLTPTIKLSATPTATPTPTPTLTPLPAAKVCNSICKTNNDCQAGTVCINLVCRNPACSTDKTCFCGTVKSATNSGITKTPETGGEEYLILLGVGGVAVLGLTMKRWAKKIW